MQRRYPYLIVPLAVATTAWSLGLLADDAKGNLPDSLEAFLRVFILGLPVLAGVLIAWVASENTPTDDAMWRGIYCALISYGLMLVPAVIIFVYKVNTGDFDT